MNRNHEMEKIYMQQLRDMESAVYLLEKKKKQCEYSIYKLRLPYSDPLEPKKPEFHIGNFLIEKVIFSNLIIPTVLTTVAISFFIYLFTDLFQKHEFLGIFSMFILPCIVVIIRIILLFIKEVENYHNDEKDYYFQIKQNEDIRQKNKQGYSINCSKADQKSKELVMINNELQKAQYILAEAYSINWLPKGYRNIRVVYYIEDMVTTSDINIDEALKYYLLQEANNKLEQILLKLDKIIENQNEIICQQAIEKSKNDALICQNQQMISQLANIETNTKLSADYSAINANYSAATAYFSLATYLKN